MEINILIYEEYKEQVDTGWLESVAEQALSAEKVCPRAEMGLVITGPEQVRELNRDYRDVDEPTDVLAFALLEGKDESSFIAPPDGVLHLGEVIISYPQAVVQAGEARHPVRKELALLVVHGILHLLGYDHDKPELEKIMRAREVAILERIGESKG